VRKIRQKAALATLAAAKKFGYVFWNNQKTIRPAATLRK